MDPDFSSKTQCLVREKKLSFSGMMKAYNREFAKEPDFQQALRNTVNYSNASTFCCEKNCQNFDRIVAAHLALGDLLLNTQKQMPLGLFLSNFMNFTKTGRTFQSGFLSQLNGPGNCDFPGNGADRFLHGYLEEISGNLGISDPKISVFDLASMFATVDESNLDHPSISLGFPFSNCKFEENFRTTFSLRFCLEAWTKYMSGNNKHPCDAEEDQFYIEGKKAETIAKSCCHFWSKLTGNDVTNVMKIMRLASRRGQPLLDIEDFLAPYLNTAENK